jgi:hypothetical protein
MAEIPYVYGGTKNMRNNPISSPAKIGILAGLAAGLGAAIYYATRPAVTATATIPPATPPVTPTPPPPTTTPSTPPNGTKGGGSFTPAPPIVSTPTPGNTTGALTYSATEINNGAIYNMHVGDTLNVVLSLTPPIANYEGSATGSILTEGVYNTAVAGQISQPWIATAVGSSTVSYQASNASHVNQGVPLTFNVVVS